MIMAEQQRDWFQQLLCLTPESGDDNVVWLNQARKNAKRAIEHLPPLHRKQEAWRYSRIHELFARQFAPVVDSDIDVSDIDLEHWLLPDYETHRLVFVNGRFVAALSDIDKISPGLTLGSLRAAFNISPQKFDLWFNHVSKHTEQLFTALNTALFNDGVFIHIDSDTQTSTPLEVIYLNTDSNNSTDDVENTNGFMIHTRNLISLDEGASATVIERFISSEDTNDFHNNLTEISLANGASLKHYRVQEESRQAFHLSNLFLSQHENSNYTGTNLAFGGAWARTEYRVDFKGQSANCNLNGLYTVGDQQLNDLHLDVQHTVPACTSRENFKGILYGNGRAVFDGHILVDRDAQHSDAALTNDNLMLNDDAEVDTKPQLEIYADNVKCNHGTTVGQLDPQQVFYLRSRGIAEAMAHKMLCQGFAAEIIDTIDQQPLRKHISTKLEHTLNQLALAGG